jgi:16S rRNA (cytosine1402-N4)-methyltransferase
MERGAPSGHLPVMYAQVLEGLNVRGDGTYLDGTFGRGGHARGVLERLGPGGRLLLMDKDPEAIAVAMREFAQDARVAVFRGSFAELAHWNETAAGLDGVLFDLGVSSMQLDVRERGFAYSEDAPLDMRMDGTTGPTAADVLNTYSAADLTRVLRDYGEERFARKIANAIVRQREQAPFTTSARLVELLFAEIPAPARRTGGHPAKRTFQALRMEVNDELAVLRRAIPAAIDAIAVGGRVVVESYHSLEDRLVKRAFADATRSTVPEDLPFVPEGSAPALRLVTRGAERADESEIAQNPRAASVRLRALERITPIHLPRGAA